MAPKSEPPERPPGGMWFETREGSKPFRARWRLSDGTKTGAGFESEVERAKFAAKWAKQRKEFGTAAKFVDARTVQMWQEFAEITGNVAPLLVARQWAKMRGSKGEAQPATIEAAWGKFDADQAGRKLAADSHSHRVLHGKRLCGYFRGRLVGGIKAEDLDGWLASLKNPDTGEAMSPKSKVHHLKTARHFFEWLWRRRRIEFNPALAVTVPDGTVIGESGEAVHRDINIVSVREAFEFFRVNADCLCVGRLALEAFGGLRYTSAARVRREHIAWEECGVEMPGHAHKSGVRHFVDGWPANLWAWMRHAPKACWDIHPRNYADLKREAFERAGMKPLEQEREWTKEEAAQFEAMRNVWRHSFATYHLAAYKNAALTAELLTKTSQASLKRDYRGRATQADGLLYVAITPEEVRGGWARFVNKAGGKARVAL